MSYTMADYRRDTAKEYFKELTAEEQREVLQSLASEQQHEVLRGLTPEQRLAGLSAEEIATYLKKLQSKRPSRKRNPRGRS
jgi:Mg/Co/Ni transporter MgtE